MRRSPRSPSVACAAARGCPALRIIRQIIARTKARACGASARPAAGRCGKVMSRPGASVASSAPIGPSSVARRESERPTEMPSSSSPGPKVKALPSRGFGLGSLVEFLLEAVAGMAFARLRPPARRKGWRCGRRASRGVERRWQRSVDGRRHSARFLAGAGLSCRRGRFRRGLVHVGRCSSACLSRPFRSGANVHVAAMLIERFRKTWPPVPSATK